MKVATCVRYTASVCVLVLSLGCCLGPAERIELGKTGECPSAREGKCVTVEGFFGIPEKGLTTEAGYEASYPYTRFAFSAEQAAKSKFEAGLVRANDGNNGPEKANRMMFAERGVQPPFHIYDNLRNEVSFNDRVRISGVMIRDCVVKVDKIEKL